MGGSGPRANRFVHYRVLKPDVYKPPKEHKRIDGREYVGPYSPELELADELDAIRVLSWGD